MDKLNKNKEKSGGSLDKVYKLDKAAEFLCLSVSTLRKKIKKGDINAIQYQAGGRLMIAESEIIRLRSAYKQIDKTAVPYPEKPLQATPAATPLPAPDPAPVDNKKIDNSIVIGVC